ncbi:MAG: reverse transcriptase domain-containing protein [Ktedonobacteraceae bacterium]
MKEGLQEADWSTRRDIIRALVKRVEIDQEQVNVIFRIGPQTPLNPSDTPTHSLQHCGGVLSPLLANVALHGMAQAIQQGYKGKDKPRLVRYADDLVVLYRTREGIDQARSTLERWLKDRGLEMKPSKTRVAHTLEA